MITDIAAYLRFFDSVRRRTERDVSAPPPSAAAWRPPAVGGEAGWRIGQIIGHIGTARTGRGLGSARRRAHRQAHRPARLAACGRPARRLAVLLW